MKRVYIVNNNQHSYAEPISKLGDVNPEPIAITTGSQNIFMTDQLLDIMRLKVKDFKQTDYLLLSGSAILNILATNAVLELYPYVDVLLYHIKKNIYIPRRIDKVQ